ncbi:MAG: nuclear transport factor 2 family protein [Steroidobacteraceae bacterium]
MPQEEIAAASAGSIAEAAHVSAITQLVLAERECRDMGRWERMKACFHPDAQVRISWFQGNAHDFVDASRGMASRGVLAKHRLGPVSVRVNGTRAVATLALTIDIPSEARGVSLLLSSHARVFYRAELRQGQWRLSSFEVFYLRDELFAQVPGEAVPVTAADVAGYRKSYRFMSFVLAQGGFTVRDDLAGEDRPETVDALCREIYGWAGLPL